MATKEEKQKAVEASLKKAREVKATKKAELDRAEKEIKDLTNTSGLADPVDTTTEQTLHTGTIEPVLPAVPVPVPPFPENSELKELKTQLQEQQVIIKEIYANNLKDVYKPEELTNMSLRELKVAQETIKRLDKPKGVPRVPETAVGDPKRKTRIYDGLTGKYIEKKETTYQ